MTDPQALVVCVAAQQAVHFIGLYFSQTALLVLKRRMIVISIQSTSFLLMHVLYSTEVSGKTLFFAFGRYFTSRMRNPLTVDDER